MKDQNTIMTMKEEKKDKEEKPPHLPPKSKKKLAVQAIDGRIGVQNAVTTLTGLRKKFGEK